MEDSRELAARAPVWRRLEAGNKRTPNGANEPKLMISYELVTELAKLYNQGDKRIEPYLWNKLSKGSDDWAWTALNVLQCVNKASGRLSRMMQHLALNDDGYIALAAGEALAYADLRSVVPIALARIRRGERGWANVLTLLNHGDKLPWMIRSLNQILTSELLGIRIPKHTMLEIRDALVDLAVDQLANA